MLELKNLKSLSTKFSKEKKNTTGVFKKTQNIISPLKISKISSSLERNSYEYPQTKWYWLSVNEADRKNRFHNKVINAFANDYIQCSLRDSDRESKNPGRRSSKKLKRKRRSVIEGGIKTHQKATSQDLTYSLWDINNVSLRYNSRKC